MPIPPTRIGEVADQIGRSRSVPSGAAFSRAVAKPPRAALFYGITNSLAGRELSPFSCAWQTTTKSRACV